MRRLGACVLVVALAGTGCGDAAGSEGAADTSGGGPPPTRSPGAAAPASTAPPAAGCEAVGIQLVPAFQAFVDLVDQEQLTFTPPLPTLVDNLLTAALPRSNLTAFVDADAEAQALAGEAAGWEGVLEVEVVTKEGALAEAREMFAHDPDLLAVVEREPEVLPASVRLDVADAAFEGLAARLRDRPEVIQVNELRASEVLEIVLPSPTVSLAALLLPGTDPAALGGTIAGWTGVVDVEEFTEEETLEAAREAVAGDPDLLAAVEEVGPGSLPASLRIEVDRARATDVHERVSRANGVIYVDPPGAPAAWAEGAELAPYASIARAAGPAVLAANELGCAAGELAPVVAAHAGDLTARTVEGRAFVTRIASGE